MRCLWSVRAVDLYGMDVVSLSGRRCNNIAAVRASRTVRGARVGWRRAGSLRWRMHAIARLIEL